MRKRISLSLNKGGMTCVACMKSEQASESWFNSKAGMRSAEELIGNYEAWSKLCHLKLY
jgi:hypothetical protein